MPAKTALGVSWGVASALGSALFLIPWKMASRLGPTHINLLILVVASAVFSTLAWPLFARVGRPAALPARTRRAELLLAFQLAVLTLLGNWASAAAITRLSPPLLSVIQRVEVLVVALCAWLVLGERVDRRFWIGVAIAACGFLLVQDDVLHGTFGLAGLLFGVAAATCFALMSVLARKHAQAIDPLVVNTQRLWLSVLIWFAANGVPDALRDISREQVLYASLAGLFGPFFSRLCLMYSLRYVEARISALAVLTAPLMTLVLSYLWFSELPSAQQMLGGALMLLGIAVPIVRLRSR